MKKLILILVVSLCMVFIGYTTDLNKAKDIISFDELNNLTSSCLLEQANTSTSPLPTFEDHIIIGTELNKDTIIIYLTGFSMSYKIIENTAYENSGGEFTGTMTLCKVKDNYVISSYNFPLSTDSSLSLFKGSYKDKLQTIDSKLIRENEREKAIDYFNENNINTSNLKVAN